MNTKKLTVISIALCLLVIFGGIFTSAQTPDVRPLTIGQTVERELKGDEAHSYSLTLKAGQYLDLAVEQKGIDVVITLFEPGGRKITEVDNPNETPESKVIRAVTEVAGSYRLTVRSSVKDAAVGRYIIRIEELRTATVQDKMRAAEQIQMQEAERLNQSAEMLLDEGKYEEAIEASKRALAIREKILGDDSLKINGSLADLAKMYRANDDFLNAEKMFKRVVAINEKNLGTEHIDLIRPLINLATLYIETGEYVRSEPIFQRALAISEQKLAADDLLTAVLLNNMGELYYYKGDLARAEEFHSRALAIREKKLEANNPLISRSLNNLAKIYDVQGDYARAEPLYQRALAILEKVLGEDDPAVAVPLTNLAALYGETGKLELAESLLLRSLAIYEKALGPDNLELASPLNNLGQLYVEKGNYAEAERLYQRSLKIIENVLGENHPDVADTLGNLADLYAAKGNTAQAIAVRTRANNISERNLGVILSVGSEKQKQLYLATLFDETNETISLHNRSARNSKPAALLALTTILRRKGRVLDATSNQLEGLRRRSNPQSKILIEQLISARSQLASLILEGPGDAESTQYQAAVAKLQSENERLEAAVSTRSAELRVELQPVTIDRVKSAIPGDAALVEITSYIPYDAKVKKIAERYGESRYAVYVLRHDGSLSWVDLGEASVIDGDVGKLRKALNDPQLTDPAKIKQLARTLDAKLMFPIRKLLGSTRHILLSPDGALNLIPFGALVDEGGKYLIENYSFTYLTSGRDLLRLQVKTENTQSPVIFANPSFDTGISSGNADLVQTDVSRGKRAADFREENWADLPATQDEATEIKAIMPDARVFTKTDATEAALKKIERPRFLHIASHGFFLEDKKVENSIENPLLRSGLILAGANKRQSGAGEDGILTALEAAGLNLWGTKLVVLSACDTGIGDVQNGEGVYGLRRALVLAGAESQLLSLWQVQDAATRDLMVEFYKRLQHGEGRTEALRQAQLTMLRGTRELRRHPYFWAGFIESGDWRSINSPIQNAK